MPSLDGGHLFLTVLAPVKTDTMIDPIVGRSRSHRHMLAQKLALLPTGRQTAVSAAGAWASPFAANTLNHLARFVIIDSPNFNGRVSDDTLVALIRKVNPLAPQPVDRLACPYLLFAADVDAPGDGPAALRAYTDVLWDTMNRDIVQIFSHCCGFDGVADKQAFYDFVAARQIDTTMPFNDYWANGLDVGKASLPTGPLIGAAVIAAIALVAWLASLLLGALFGLVHLGNGFTRFIAGVAGWGLIVTPILIGLALLAALGLYGFVAAKAAKPFPTAPGSDLPSILKSLFVQQNFTRFATQAQGLDDSQLYARFGDFLHATRPADPAPALKAGEVHAPMAEW